MVITALAVEQECTCSLEDSLIDTKQILILVKGIFHFYFTTQEYSNHQNSFIMSVMC